MTWLDLKEIEHIMVLLFSPEAADPYIGKIMAQ